MASWSQRRDDDDDSNTFSLPLGIFASIHCDLSTDYLRPLDTNTPPQVFSARFTHSGSPHSLLTLSLTSGPVGPCVACGRNPVASPIRLLCGHFLCAAHFSYFAPLVAPTTIPTAAPASQPRPFPVSLPSEISAPDYPVRNDDDDDGTHLLGVLTQTATDLTSFRCPSHSCTRPNWSNCYPTTSCSCLGY